MATHRMPAISASQALQTAATDVPKHISLGLKALDNATQHGPFSGIVSSGLPRGRVTELFGPPGVGKTSLCLEAAASCILSGGLVTWIDAGHCFVPARLQAALIKHGTADYNRSGVDDETTGDPTNLMAKLKHYDIPTLAHLIALLLLSPQDFPGQGTSLVVIESLATLVDAAYPRTVHPEFNTVREASQSSMLSNRRQEVIASIATGLSNLAAVNNIVVVVTNPVVTRIKREGSALLKPALSGQVWESKVTLRLALFRDWAYDTQKQQAHAPSSARFVKMVRGATRATQTTLDPIFAFDVQRGGILELPTASVSQHRHNPHSTEGTHSNKRSHSELVSSEADNSDSEYGWAEDDFQLAAQDLADDPLLSAEVRYQAEGGIGDG